MNKLEQQSEQQSRSNPLGAAVYLILPFLVLGWPSRAGAQQMAAITVVGLDYAFQAPATLPAGLTAVGFENHGKVRHEVAIVRLKPGVTVDSVVHMKAGPARRALIDFVGLLAADPGETPLGRILVEFMAGRTYALFCNLQDAPDKPPHLTMGMFASIQVK
jgi:hypothetical protein